MSSAAMVADLLAIASEAEAREHAAKLELETAKERLEDLEGWIRAHLGVCPECEDVDCLKPSPVDGRFMGAIPQIFAECEGCGSLFQVGGPVAPEPGFDACERCGGLDTRGDGCPWCGNEGQIPRRKDKGAG